VAPDTIRRVRECPPSGACLVIDTDGRWRLRPVAGGVQPR
jgi:hypothetical protein